MELSILAANIRTLVKWAGYSLLGLFFVWIFWLIISFSFNLFFPAGPTTADSAFGKINKPFENTPENKDLVFDLETPGENFPQIPAFLPVYEIPPLEGKFTSLENGTSLAKGFGLDSEPIRLNEPIWRWTNTKNQNQSLKLNIVTNNFNYLYDWVADPSILAGVFKANDDEIVENGRRYLTRFQSLKDDFKNGETRVTYWKLEGNTRRPVSSLSEANAAMVEFFRKPITFNKKEYEIAEANPNLGSVNVLLSPAIDTTKQLIELNFNYWGINFENLATYDLRSAEEAYDDLKSGDAYIASGNSDKFKKVTVDKIYLAYFNPTKETRLIQPIFVFEGEGSVGSETEKFIAYVPAVTADFLK